MGFLTEERGGIAFEMVGGEGGETNGVGGAIGILLDGIGDGVIEAGLDDGGEAVAAPGGVDHRVSTSSNSLGLAGWLCLMRSRE